ncbi:MULTISPECIES: hypothetical protein [Parabacteroides]|uniref:hypothetical protein n=1 Tax=Parabacteroides provencensis TaxID=1944636 RepID=UPI000C1574BC|nr:hypothetical protein [Parabacteroides provencensis]
MDEFMNAVIREVAKHTRKMYADEVIGLLSPLKKSMGFELSEKHLILPWSKISPLPLRNIRLVLVTSTHVYILFCTGMLHSLCRMEQEHLITYAEDGKLGFGEILLGMCRRFFRKFGMKK